jgi:hypothetical protein
MSLLLVAANADCSVMTSEFPGDAPDEDLQFRLDIRVLAVRVLPIGVLLALYLELGKLLPGLLYNRYVGDGSGKLRPELCRASVGP